MDIPYDLTCNLILEVNPFINTQMTGFVGKTLNHGMVLNWNYEKHMYF